MPAPPETMHRIVAVLQQPSAPTPPCDAMPQPAHCSKHPHITQLNEWSDLHDDAVSAMSHPSPIATPSHPSEWKDALGGPVS